MNDQPKVSIIIAAYNRSNVLACAIKSVLLNTFEDWELIVVGDHCTDDSQDVVEGFRDRRISFVNLPSNSGAQSDPNNAGAAMARGRYIAYLNQDDLFFPDHLARSIASITRFGTHFVWCPVAVALPSNREVCDLDAMHFSIGGVHPSGGYDSSVLIVASSWFMRRDVVDAVGPWRRADTIYHSPSQEWLFRAAKCGIVMSMDPHISVLCVHSGLRPGSYARREDKEHRLYIKWLEAQQDFPSIVKERAGIFLAGALQQEMEPDLRGAARKLGRAMATATAGWLRIRSPAFLEFLSLKMPGEGIEQHRKTIFKTEKTSADRGVRND